MERQRFINLMAMGAAGLAAASVMPWPLKRG